MKTTPLGVLHKLPSYREHRQHIFPSEGSLQWFVRKHRDVLVADGALVLIAGQWHAHEERFDAYVLEAGAKAARQHSEAT